MNRFLGATIAILAATTAAAQDAGELSVAAGVSTLGANLEAAFQPDPSYRIRGGLIGGIDVSYEESDADSELAGDAELGGLMLLGDYYPLQNGWRLSGGLFFSNTELSATGTTDVEGLGTEAVSISAAFTNEVSPMITTGYDLAFGDGWSFNSEAGIIFTGGIDLEFVADNELVQDDVDNDPDVQEAIADAGDINIFPYIGLSLSYRF